MLPPPCLDHLLANFFESPIYISNTWLSLMCPKWTYMPPFSSYINLYIFFTSLLKSHTSLPLSPSLSLIVNLTLFIPSYKTKPKANNQLSHPNKTLKHIQSQLLLSLSLINHSKYTISTIPKINNHGFISSRNIF